MHSSNLKVLDSFLCMLVLIVFGHLRVRVTHQRLDVLLREILLLVYGLLRGCSVSDSETARVPGIGRRVDQCLGALA